MAALYRSAHYCILLYTSELSKVPSSDLQAMTMPIILATSNAGKIRELRELLAPRECIPQQDFNIADADETGKTFIENALIKARHASQIIGKPALADDSGLVIPALNGQPGIFSARFAGIGCSNEDNIAHVLSRLKECAIHTPSAYFYCTIVLLQHADDPTPLIATGRCQGQIITTPTGKHGFGYDPIFYLPEYRCTMAELPAEIKNTLSHRAQALHQLCTQLPTAHS